MGAILSWSVCTLMIGVTQSPSGLLAWRAALAFAQALYFPAAVALISNLHSEYTRSTALSLHGSAQFVGVIFGGWYGGFATEALGWRWMLWILAAAGTAYGLVLYFRLEDKQPPARPATPSTVDNESGSTGVFTPTYLALCISFFAICAMIWLIYAWLPDIVRERFNLPLGTAGLVATAYAQVAMIAGLVCAAPLGDWLMKQTKRGRLYVMLVGLIVCSPFLHILVRCQTLEGVRLAALGYGFFTGLFTANFLACVFDVVPKEKRGFAAGFANMIGGIARRIVGLPGGVAERPVLGRSNVQRRGRFRDRLRHPASRDGLAAVSSRLRQGAPRDGAGGGWKPGAGPVNKVFLALSGIINHEDTKTQRR